MKRKTLQKLFATVLATAMAISVAGCGTQPAPNEGSESPEVQTDSTEPASDSTDSSETETESEPSSEEEGVGAYSVRIDENGNPIDLGGIEVIIRDWWSTDETTEEAVDGYSEARQEYLDWAQETYNFTVKQQAISSWETVPEDFANYVTTGGDDNYYVFALRTGDEFIAAMNSELMYDVSTLDCLDFTEEKWVTAILDQYSKKGAIYGFRTHIGDMLGGRGVYFNKRILSEANIDPQQIYEWQKNGEWTWEKFEEVCAQVESDTDNDGMVDVFAMAAYNTVWYTMAVYSNGGSFISQDENGNYINTVENNEAISALNWAWDMWDRYDASKAYPEDASWDYFLTMFQTGKACFLPAELWRAGGFNEGMEDDFGYACFPMGPNSTDYVNVCSDNPYAIPACYDAEKAWKVAFAWDIFTEPTPGYEDYVTWRTTALQNFRDTDAVDLTVTKLMSCGRPAYDALIPGINTTDVIWKIDKNNTPAQAAEAVRFSWQAFLDEANK